MWCKTLNYFQVTKIPLGLQRTALVPKNPCKQDSLALLIQNFHLIYMIFQLTIEGNPNLLSGGKNHKFAQMTCMRHLESLTYILGLCRENKVYQHAKFFKSKSSIFL